MIFARADLAQKIDKAVFPGMQGGPHENTIAGIAVALQEALQSDFKNYAKAVVDNARVLAEQLSEKYGFDLVSGGTDNHLLLIDLTKKAVTGKKAEHLLEEAGMTTNKNMVPFDKLSPFVTSGIRIGTAALTTRGFKEAEMVAIAKFINDVGWFHRLDFIIMRA